MELTTPIAPLVGILAMTTSSPQTVSSLTAADSHQLDRQRAVVEKYLGDPASRSKYATAPGKLGTLRAILKAGLFKPSQTYELQSMGVVLGDAFVVDMGFHWVIVEDENGRDPAIRFKETSVILFPLTMISKRIERGDVVDVFDLYNGVAAEAEKLIQRETGGKSN